MPSSAAERVGAHLQSLALPPALAAELAPLVTFFAPLNETIAAVNVSHLLAELEIGFEAIDDGLWNVYFGPVWLGRFHEAVGRIVDQRDRPARRRGGNHKGKVLPIS